MSKIYNRLISYATGLPDHCVSDKALIHEAAELIKALTEEVEYTHWKEARLSSGRTIRDVAQAVKTNAGNLSRIENGKQKPNKALAARIRKEFDEWKQDAGDRA